MIKDFLGFLNTKSLVEICFWGWCSLLVLFRRANLVQIQDVGAGTWTSARVVVAGRIITIIISFPSPLHFTCSGGVSGQVSDCLRGVVFGLPCSWIYRSYIINIHNCNNLISCSQRHLLYLEATNIGCLVYKWRLE